MLGTPLRGRVPSGALADLSLAALVVAERARLPQPPLDDAFIVLAVARNALAGLGPHLDPGSGDAVLSTLLWPGLVGVAMAAGLPGLVALRLLGTAAELALALAMRRLGTSLSGSTVAGALAAAALMTHPVVVMPSFGGMESAVNLALVATAAWGWSMRRPWTAAIAAGFLPWARVDGLLAAAILLVALALREPGSRQRAAWIGGSLVAAAAPLTQRLLFGVWLPGSVTAKLETGGGAWSSAALEVGTEFARSLAGMSAYWLVRPTPHLLLVPVALLGAWRLARRREAGVAAGPLWIWALLYVAAFSLSGRGYARNFPWYFAPPLLAFVALAAVGAAPLARRLEARLGAWRPALPPLVVALVALSCVPALAAGLRRVDSRFFAHRERAYAAAAEWLGRFGPARSLASNEVGALAWYSPPGTRIVDLLGLSRPPGAPVGTAATIAAQRRPEAIVARVDFRLAERLASSLSTEFVWIRAGSLDIGLEPALAERLRPHAAELAAIYRRGPASPSNHTKRSPASDATRTRPATNSTSPSSR